MTLSAASSGFMSGNPVQDTQRKAHPRARKRLTRDANGVRHAAVQVAEQRSGVLLLRLGQGAVLGELREEGLVVAARLCVQLRADGRHQQLIHPSAAPGRTSMPSQSRARLKNGSVLDMPTSGTEPDGWM